MILLGFPSMALGGKPGKKVTRLRKLRGALRELLVRGKSSGKLLEVVLGHVTWAMLCRREGLALLDKCYSFIHASYEVVTPLWPSVRRELHQVMCLLPLFSANLSNPWHNEITASDSSPAGYGICMRRDLPASIIACVGNLPVKNGGLDSLTPLRHALILPGV